MLLKRTAMRQHIPLGRQGKVVTHSYLAQADHQSSKCHESPLRTMARLISTHSGFVLSN
jgi:hypothetical protein